jgi:DNA polymerase V
MFALVDCNNFYASCEQVFNPKLERKPLVVLSNNDGIVIARSQKAKALGVKMGQPVFELRAQIERGEIEALSSNFTLYADMSQRVMQTLADFSPDMEIYSIDEAFFQLVASPALRKRAIEIRKKVKQWTGIPVSIGIAETKTLAKIANEAAKKEKEHNSVYLLTDAEERLAKTEVEEIWGIGSQLASRLNKQGIYTAKQLRDADDQRIRKLLGVQGLRTAMELRGIPCFPLMEEPEKKKSIVCSRSFSQKIDTLPLLCEAVSSFAARAAEKLREQKSKASFLSVFLMTSPFQEPYVSRSCHVQIPVATAYTPELIALAKQGLSQIFQEGLAYKKAGVLLGDFLDGDCEPLDLFILSEKGLKKAKAMETLDKINIRYDKAAIQFAAQGIRRKWQESRCAVSPRFTTSWHELLKVK